VEVGLSSREDYQKEKRTLSERIEDRHEDDGSNLTWTYTTFKVDGASTKYKLIVGGGKGTGLDSFAYHNGRMFTTIDNDNDRYRKNCGFEDQAGWWYDSCYRGVILMVFTQFPLVIQTMLSLFGMMAKLTVVLVAWK
jgi:hypothetical protein